MAGLFAASLKGHDKDQIYIIIREEAEYVYLADGITRTREKPKRKNRKHIQIIKNPVPVIDGKPLAGRNISNEEIKRAIKIYGGRKTDVKS